MNVMHALFVVKISQNV